MDLRTELAQLALYVYTPVFDENRPFLPNNWTPVEPPFKDDANGFSYGIFQHSSGKVVVAYTGTNGGIDWIANAGGGLGAPNNQTNAAALVAARVIDRFGESNVSFTGHSLGGGLASVMAVWFNCPALNFDEAPFQNTALSLQSITQAQGHVALNGYSNLAFSTYNPFTQFAIRESKVESHFLEGEFLDNLRYGFTAIYNEAGQVKIPINTNGLGLLGAITLHSQALLTASLLSDSFRASTFVSDQIISRIFDSNLYGKDTERNFLLDLIRSEQQTPGNSKLTHFAADLQKLGTNIAGLNRQAQTAMIAQGIEWYYWQSSNYSGGKEFFTQTGQLFQYTTAKGDGLTGALSKADLYTKPWLQAISAEHGYGGSAGTSAFPAFGTAYDQWNVGAGTTGVTATARADNKAQIFIGQSGSDTFTGGSKDDVIFAGAGNDTLDGKGGNDKLYGGAGTDIYNFKDAFAKDTITDSDGQGTIQIDGGLGDDSTPEKNQRRMLFVLEREQEQKSQVTDRKTALYQGALKAANGRYRIRSCLRPFLLGCRVISYKKSSAHPVQCVQTQRAYGWCGRGRPDARSEVTR